MSPSTKPSPKSLCLVRLSALGDVVLVLPLVRHVQKHWPGCRLTWIIGKAAHEAVSGLAAEGVEFIVIDKPRGPADYLALRRSLSGRRFDAMLCLQASWRANFIYPLIRADRKIGYGPDRAKDLHRLFVREPLPPARPHLAEGFLQFAEALGLPFPEAPEWGLPISAEAKAWADATLPGEAFFALSPCSSKSERDWAPENFAELLRVLHSRGQGPIVVFGGPSAKERAAIDIILGLAKVPVLDLAGKTRVPQLVAALARCRLLIAPDTGAVHIANAFGRPVVGLYAVAPASRTGPYPDSSTCVDRYDDALFSLLGRRRAEVPWAQRVHHRAAMALIKPGDVMERVDMILKREEHNTVTPV